MGQDSSSGYLLVVKISGRNTSVTCILIHLEFVLLIPLYRYYVCKIRFLQKGLALVHKLIIPTE
jgi:hypothetical protein